VASDAKELRSEEEKGSGMATDPRAEVTYRFSGAIERTSAYLMVRLSYTGHFKLEDRWRYAAEFSRRNERLGFAMREVEEEVGELEIYFYPGVDGFDRVTFLRFVTDHLEAQVTDVVESLRLCCGNCGKEVQDREPIEARVRERQFGIPCQYCDSLVMIPRSIEERYRSRNGCVRKQRELRRASRKRTAPEIGSVRNDGRQYSAETDDRIRILHLSDIHMESPADAGGHRAHLETDLIKELGISRLDYLVISGDIASHSTPDEYDGALELVEGVAKRFGLNPGRIVVVPGNHDLSWDLSEAAYSFVSKRKLPMFLKDGYYISAGELGALIRDDESYARRFDVFSERFYKKVYRDSDYPTEYARQGILYPCPDDRIVFLGLNSSWNIDHYFHDRASINTAALANVLETLLDGGFDDWLKIAVWHHPLAGPEAMDDQFMEQLAVHHFQICMHGHIHEAIERHHKYDDERGIQIIGAGTFGSPTRAKGPRVPLQYNVLTLDQDAGTGTVDSRKKEMLGGAWSADARWVSKQNPVPRYSFEVRW
jgi:predicted phosphodiesterase